MKFFLKFIILFFLIASTVHANTCENEALLDSVLKQVNLKQTLGSLKDCTVDPINNEQIILAYAHWNAEENDESEDVGNYTLYFFKINRKDLKLVYRFNVENKLFSDALNLENISLDTTHYKISENNRAIGLRLQYRVYSSVNPASMVLLNLYDFQNKKQILENFIMISYHAETNGRCNASVEENNLNLIMQSSKTNMNYDIQAVNKNVLYEGFETEEGCSETDHQISLQKFLLKFDGTQYQLPHKYRKLFLY